MKITIATTSNFLALCVLAKGRNRSVHVKKVRAAIDPDGTHLLDGGPLGRFLHNDCEWRTHWFMKIKGSMEPQSIWLDVPLDAFDELTTQMEVPDL